MIFSENKTPLSSVLKLLTGLFVISAFMLIQQNSASAASTCNWLSTVDSDWENTANWDCMAVPTSTTIVIIPATTTTVLGATSLAGTLTVGAGATITASTYALTVASTLANSGVVTSTTGTLTFTGAATNNAGGIIASNTGNMMFGSTLANAGTLDVGTGVATTTGSLTNTGTVYGRTGKLAMVADYSGAGAFTAGTGTVTFYGGANQAIRGVTFYNLETRKSAGTVTVNTANMVVGGVFDTYDAGTLDAAALNFSVTGATTIRPGATVTSTSGTLTFTGAATSTGSIGSVSGNMLFGSTLSNNGTLDVGSGTATSTGTLTNAGTVYGRTGKLALVANYTGSGFTAGTGTVTLYGTAAQSIRGVTFYNLEVRKASNTATIATANAAVGGTLNTYGAGKLDLVAQTLTVTGASTIGSGTTVTSTSGDLTFAGVTNVGSLGTVSGNQIMTSMTNSGTWELGAESTSTGVVTNTGTLYLRSNTLHVGGNWTDSSGTLTPGTGTIEINGTGAQSISADDTMYDLTINKTAGTATLTGNVTTTDNLTITNGTLDIDSYTFSVGGDYSNDDTLDGGTGTVKFNGTGAQSIGTEANFYALTISKTAGTATMVGHVSTTNMTVTDGTLAVADKILYVSGTYDNADTVSLTTGKIKSAAEQIAFVNSSGVEQTSYTTPSNVYLQIEDQNQNLLAGTAETMTVTFSGNAISGSDSDTITLTETGIATGIFRSAAIPFITSPVIHANNDEWEVSNSGVGTESFTDSQDSSDTGTDTVTLVYSAATVGGTGGGGGGGSVAPVTATYQSSQSDPNRAANLTNLATKGLSVNSLVKLPDDGKLDTQEDSAVYYIGTDGKRHAFPNSKVYFTWYASFDGVTVISADSLASVPLGSNARYRPGVRMIKFTTDPKVYAVDAHGVLNWVKTEEVANSLYGDTWNTKIDDMSDAFFGNYTFGTEISSSASFNPTSLLNTITSVSTDYGW
ncbi:MAG: hypothetical protein PHS79_01560 [Patescibacteria group bacterium]|nr:hypothetical protein [Patescibacteria group bacterium]